MYLSSQLFFKTHHETLKFQEKSKKMQFPAICRPKFQNIFFQCLPRGYPMEPLNSENSEGTVPLKKNNCRQKCLSK